MKTVDIDKLINGIKENKLQNYEFIQISRLMNVIEDSEIEVEPKMINIDCNSCCHYHNGRLDLKCLGCCIQNPQWFKK